MDRSGIAEETGTVAVPAAGGWSEPVRLAYRFSRRQMGSHWSFVKFIVSGVLGYLLYQGALVAAYDIAGIQFFLSTLIADEVFIIGRFFVRELWVFSIERVVG